MRGIRLHPKTVKNIRGTVVGNFNRTCDVKANTSVKSTFGYSKGDGMRAEDVKCSVQPARAEDAVSEDISNERLLFVVGLPHDTPVFSGDSLIIHAKGSDPQETLNVEQDLGKFSEDRFKKRVLCSQRQTK